MITPQAKMNRYMLLRSIRKRKTPSQLSNVIKLSSFKEQKVTLPELYKREKVGLFLFDLCYQKDYKGDTCFGFCTIASMYIRKALSAATVLVCPRLSQNCSNSSCKVLSRHKFKYRPSFFVLGICITCFHTI